MTSNPHDLINAAESVLEQSAPQIEEAPGIPEELQSAQPIEASFEDMPTPPTNQLSVIPANSAELVEAESRGVGQPAQAPALQATIFQKFGDLASHLREGEGINLVEVKKLNLAVAVEALERASTAHENFPSPDAGFAVASMSEQVMKLTKDLEKSKDPQEILEDIMENSMGALTREIVQDLAAEMKKFRDESLPMVRGDKKDAFDVAFKAAVNRMGPAMKERLEVARTRIARALSVKEKERGGT